MNTFGRRIAAVMLSIALPQSPAVADVTDSVHINQIQFVGSHNSYKKAMSGDDFQALLDRNPDAARALQYEHISLDDQLNLGIRKLELDVFWTPPSFTVGHVQKIDMNSHCSTLTDCLGTITTWSKQHPKHVPIWISLNTKDSYIEGLPRPKRFDAEAFAALDQVLLSNLPNKLITPAVVKVANQPNWPTLAESRGRFLVILDEGGDKQTLYAQSWRERPMFINVSKDHPAAAVMIINNPISSLIQIQELVSRGYMVRTRADADTHEARQNNTERREAAFKSGAQAISTDYYLPATFFGTDYVVKIPELIRCNPISAPQGCAGPFE
ncbi:MAG: hypothetical protein GKR90_06950 [Pseudomonadales bacterium]|nr:hypothetical protein [Pseudomonadales bacterium]